MISNWLVPQTQSDIVHSQIRQQQPRGIKQQCWYVKLAAIAVIWSTAEPIIATADSIINTHLQRQTYVKHRGLLTLKISGGQHANLTFHRI